MPCPKCGAETAPNAKFCFECGARLAEPKPAEGERRIVTVLFCDVKGSTTLAESLDPEEWTEIMNGAFAGLIPPITRYEGTVVRLLGDAILAFFGAPTAHEDDPERAVLAGLEMLQALSGYREKLRTERGVSEFDIRIGINTGLAVIGDVGSGQRVEYTAMGDAVNVAARLQSVARPGTVVVGETTHRVVASLFELSPLGPVELKGRSEAVQAFEVTGRAIRRADRGAVPGARSPMVGREAELRTLLAMLDELRAGHGRIVSLIGEPGIGKSRLIDELRRSWRGGARDGARAHWSDSVCESYTGSQAYLAFRPILADLVAGEAPAAASPVLRGLLGTADLAASGLEGEALAAEIRREVTATIRAAATQPAVLAFDDLHWSDPASGELLSELFALTDELPILFLLGFRPDRKTVGWRLKQSAESDYPHRYRETTLSPLRPEDGTALIRRVLDPNDLPPALCDLIAAKADGNPFFLEEIVRTLMDRAIVQRDPSGVWHAVSGAVDVPLPETLQGLLAARIDRLDESARRTLQAASVVGRTFLYGLLAAVAESDGRLDKDLSTLQRFELVTETAKLPEREFTFRHALTQDAAYASMLQRRRRELHLRVGQRLLEIAGDRLDESAGIVGQHLAQAGDPRAAALLTIAGDHARRLYALEEALAHYDRAVAHSKDAAPKLLGELYAGRGRTLELRGQHNDAIGNYEELQSRAVERRDRELEGNALALLASIYSTATARRDVAKAEELLARALAIARERQDRVLVANLQESRMWLAYFSGDLTSALEAGEEAVRIDRDLGRTEALPVALNNVSHVYRDLYRFADAESAGSSASEMFRGQGNKSMLADSLSTRSQALICVGDYDAVIGHSDEARGLSEEVQNHWGISYADFVAPLVRYERGDLSGAISGWRSCLEHARSGGFAAAEVGPQAELAGLFRDVGAYELAQTHVEAALAVARRVLPQWLKWPLAHQIRIHLAMDRVDQAREALAEIDRLPPGLDRFPFVPAQVALARAALLVAEGRAVDAVILAAGARAELESHGIVPWLADLALLEGDARAKQGDAAAARRAYEAAGAAAQRVGSRRVLWRIYAALGDRERAREIAGGLAASLESIGLRKEFEALPEVRTLA